MVTIMEINDILSPDAIIPSLRVTSKKQALQELSKKAADLTGLIAIPHGKLNGIDGLHCLFARLESPVDFDSVDEQPVDLICVLLAPESAGADHLKALARVSRLLRDRAACEKLRGSDTADAIFALMTESATSHAA